MQNKFKMYSVLTFAFAFLFTGINFAQATADLTFTTDTNVTIAGHNYVVASGSSATSVTVEDNFVTIVVPASSTLVFKSPDKYALSNDKSLTVSCKSDESYITIIGPKTVVVTPVLHTCGGGSSTGGSVGGGGGGSTTPATPATPAVPAKDTTLPADCTGGALFSASTGKNCNAATPATPATPASPSTDNTTNGVHTGPYNFGLVTLKSGSKGDAVMELQRFLNAKLNLGLVVDGKLGPKTIAVIIKWQTDNGLVPDGLIGPKTKAKMNLEA